MGNQHSFRDQMIIGGKLHIALKCTKCGIKIFDECPKEWNGYDKPITWGTDRCFYCLGWEYCEEGLFKN